VVNWEIERIERPVWVEEEEIQSTHETVQKDVLPAGK
jgi:hypothetical protein